MTRSNWHPFDYTLKFYLGELTLAHVAIPVQRRVFTLDEISTRASAGMLPTLAASQQGVLLANIPETVEGAPNDNADGWLVHCLKRYQRCYIDMGDGFDQYKSKFSSKSRSSINRKIKKFAEEAGGLDMRIYRSPEEIDTFFSLAGPVSAASYQERLLDSGLPRDVKAVEAARAAATRDEMRAFLLFAHGQAVSYLYCPVEGEVLQYAYLGYMPDYAKLSPGTVLQWLALEALFNEKRFRAFDFTEGDSDHKRFFSTHQVPCKLELLLRPNLRNRSLMGLHATLQKTTDAAIALLDRFGLKQRIKRWIRRAA